MVSLTIRLNRTIKSRLATACHDSQHEWDRKIYVIMSQYNRLPHSETGKASAEFFVEGLAKPDVPMKSPLWKTGKKRSRRFDVQDLALRNVPYQPAGQRNKLAPKFERPYKVVGADPNGVTYQVQLIGGRKVNKVHVSQIKPFYGDPYAMKKTMTTATTQPPMPPTRHRVDRADEMLGINWKSPCHIPFRTYSINRNSFAGASGLL